ncbi:class I SAM-dependent methyltransferase [Streptomyces sp. B1866]|uniref:class I SAM-dependent methyltransferase n=1 Tax=Streptomyces sp. B1866 TaxID=3075431 RepID=UPI002890FC09|nr:class I SAM-dependent methyltransferase [Streptomyces sp. B1866]MDT3397464.1 class I SAM-dependent methyltransferase [Streptomyces sp. B1866]
MDAMRNAPWDRYWSDLPVVAGEAPWDASPKAVVLHQLTTFLDHFDRTLPTADLGCGTGRQTAALATVFDRVFGLDVSDAALNAAERLSPAPNVRYHRLDACDPEAAAAFHHDHGDMNVYVRGLFHQLGSDRVDAAGRSLARLAGARGRVFLIEFPAQSPDLSRLTSSVKGVPPKLQRVLDAGIVPGQLGDGELKDVLTRSGFQIVDSGVIQDETTMLDSDGAPVPLLQDYVLAQPTGENM